MTSSPATGAMAGTIWLALAPVPITPTRLPVRSTLWSQLAECIHGPAKVSRPSMSGSLATRRMPSAAITASAVIWLVEPSAWRRSSVQPRRLVVPGHGDDLGVAAQPVGDVAALGRPLHVAEQLRLPAEVLRPSRVLVEGEAVEQARRVHPAARVRVLPPRAARLRVLLHHREVRQAELVQDAGGEHAGHAGADDHDVEALGHGERGEGLDRADARLLAHQGPVGGGHLGPHGQVHRRLEHVVVGSRRHLVAGEVGREHLARLVLDLLAVPQIGDRCGVVGEVGHDGGQRPAVGVGQDGVEIGDRHDPTLGSDPGGGTIASRRCERPEMSRRLRGRS